MDDVEAGLSTDGRCHRVAVDVAKDLPRPFGSSEEVATKEGGERTEIGASKDTAPSVEMVDVKPTLEELEKASDAAVPQVRDEDRLEGCVSFT